MKKIISHTMAFILGVGITLSAVLMVGDTTAEIPTPTPIIVEKEVIKEVVKEVVKEIEVIKEVIRKTDLEEVVANCKNSCVMIYAYHKDGALQGSGWIYNGYVITAKHGIEGATKTDIFFDDSKYGKQATIHYIDPDLDIAVLKADIDLPSVTLGDSDKLIEGEKLVSITSPDGAQNMVDECLYSGKVITETENDLGLSDTFVMGGASGGAVFNYNSELIGMVIKGRNGVMVAIPINDIKPILEKLK